MPINFLFVLNELGGSRLQFVKRPPRSTGHVMANGPRVIESAQSLAEILG